MNGPNTWLQRLATAAALVALTAGCASVAAKQEDWTGHKIGELIAQRGPADRIMLYPYGGTLYIWEKPDGPLVPVGSDTVDDAPAFGGLVHREIVLVSDAGIIMRSEVRTEHSGAR